MRTKPQCPCGEIIQGMDEDDAVRLAAAHLSDEHAHRRNSRAEILFIAE